MSELETAIDAVNKAIDSIKAMGESRTINAMVRKLIVVKAELAGSAAREAALMEAPPGKKKVGDKE